MGEIPETLCFSFRGCPFLLNICQMWWVAGLPEGLANSFLKLCFSLFLKSVREWTTSPGCHVSQLVCAKHTPCLYSGLWSPVPRVSAFLSAAGLPLLSLLPLACQWDSARFPGSSTMTASDCIHISPPAQGGGNSSSKQKTWKCNFEINTCLFWDFSLVLENSI